jgi:WD40 repeat protein
MPIDVLGARPAIGSLDPDRVVAIAFSPDGTLIASAGDDGDVKLWRVRSES